METRSVDPVFAPDESLYMRIPPACYHQGGLDHQKLAVSCVVFPDFSVSRGKYSQPEDVIRSNPQFGIVTFLVKHVPQQIPEDPAYTFQIEHHPEEDNYAHSEVRTYKDKGRDFNQKKQPSKTTRMKFRSILFDCMSVLRFPSSPLP